MKKKLIALVALVMVGVVAYEALDVSDAEARKRRSPSPPNYNTVYCAARSSCPSTPGRDILVVTEGPLSAQGGAGDDIYLAMNIIEDINFFDNSTSNDLYTGFLNGQFHALLIADRGGVDRVDLTNIRSRYASTDFQFRKIDADNDGKMDDLDIMEVNFGGDDGIGFIDHFGVGRIEYFKFSDKTLSGSNLPLSQ